MKAELTDSNARKYVTVLNHLFNKYRVLAYLEDWAKEGHTKEQKAFGWTTINHQAFRTLTEEYSIILVLDKIKNNNLSGAQAVQKYCNFLTKKIAFCQDIQLVVPVGLQIQLESILIDNVLAAEFEKGETNLAIAKKLCQTTWFKSLQGNLQQKMEQGIPPQPFHHFYFPPLHERSNYTFELSTF